MQPLFAKDINQAWSHILKKEFDSSEIVFRSILENNPKDVRCIVGLSYLLEMRHRNAESCECIQTDYENRH